MEASSHLTNFTAAHESRTRLIGDERFAFPEQHIEADNRLTWFLGLLNQPNPTTTATSKPLLNDPGQ